MATSTRLSSDYGAQVMRHTWQKASGHGGQAFGRVWAFFTAYPPLAQGLYYLLTGLWPLLAIDSYQALTKHHGDPWLVQVVGVLVLVVGATLCLAAYRRQGSPEVLLLAFGSALGLAAVEVHLVWRGYSPLYLLDAALEVGLVAFWVYGWKKATRTTAATSVLPPQAQPVGAAAPPRAVS